LGYLKKCQLQRKINIGEKEYPQRLYAHVAITVLPRRTHVSPVAQLLSAFITYHVSTPVYIGKAGSVCIEQNCVHRSIAAENLSNANIYSGRGHCLPLIIQAADRNDVSYLQHP
jgi:hypothetical protein